MLPDLFMFMYVYVCAFILKAREHWVPWSWSYRQLEPPEMGAEN